MNIKQITIKDYANLHNILLVFCTNNCAPCRAFKSHAKQVSEELDIDIGLVDIPTNITLLEKLNKKLPQHITAPPTFILMNEEGEPKLIQIGYSSYDPLIKRILDLNDNSF